MNEIIYINCLKKEAYKQFNEWKLKNNFILDYCVSCNTNKNLSIHHIDGDKRNNELSNLKILCWDCHKKIHQHFIVKYKLEKNTKKNKIKTLHFKNKMFLEELNIEDNTIIKIKNTSTKQKVYVVDEEMLLLLRGIKK